MAVSAACLLGVALYFGSPGPEGYHLLDLSTTLSATVSLFVLRPSRATRLVLATSIVACLAVAAVPNGLGANYERLVWFCLPVGCLITARVRRSVAVLAVTLPLVLGLLVTLRDLHVAAQPMSDASYYDALNRELATVPGLQDHRVEVTPDGTHTAAYALLGHAQLARGYETQSDHALNNVLFGSDLNAASYRRWLDENAVGYVVHSRLALDNLPEWVLVNRHLPGYLHEVWHDADLTLYSVDKPVPIVPVPGRVVRVTQSRFTFTLPSATPQQGVVVRLRWSRFLRLTGASDGARLSPAPGGWLTVVTNGPCTCTLSS